MLASSGYNMYIKVVIKMVPMLVFIALADIGTYITYGKQPVHEVKLYDYVTGFARSYTCMQIFNFTYVAITPHVIEPVLKCCTMLSL